MQLGHVVGQTGNERARGEFVNVGKGKGLHLAIEVGAQIGGNVNEPSGNYNLGTVGPLRTTVRITTRTLNSVTGGSKQLTVKWAGSANFTGYEVQIATDADFTKNVKTVKIANAKTYQTTIKNLKARTTYYVRVRSYHLFENMTYYGGWSNVISAKTK